MVSLYPPPQSQWLSQNWRLQLTEPQKRWKHMGRTTKSSFNIFQRLVPKKSMVHGPKKPPFHPPKSNSAGWGEEEARLMDLDADQKVTFQDRDPAMKPMEPPIKQHCMGWIWKLWRISRMIVMHAIWINMDYWSLTVCELENHHVS